MPVSENEGYEGIYRPFERLIEKRMEGLRFQSRLRGESFRDFVVYLLDVLEVMRLREQLENRVEKSSDEIKTKSR